MKISFFIALCAIVLLGGFLRFYKISTNPPGLYVDEAAIGLNAYDILKTGKDEYGIPYPLAFKSFDDYKMPGYIYLTALSMKVFGKNEFAIRFPSALSGTFTIIVIVFLLRKLLLYEKKTSTYANRLGLLGGLLFAILPWHLLISRGGFEVTLALFFYSVGLLSSLYFLSSNKLWNAIVTALFFVFAMYTYHSYRIIVPLTVLAAVVLLCRDRQRIKNIFIATVFFFILSFPLLLFSLTNNGRARFLQTSAFADNPYTNFVTYPADLFIYSSNYFSYFSLTYLFRYGDQINRHQVNDFGLLYIWQLPCILMGLYFLTKTKNKLLRFVVLFLLLIGPIPAALARPSPHSLRFLLGTVVFTFLTIIGLYQLLLTKGRWVKKVCMMTALLALVEFTYYIHYYYVHYPQESLLDWGGACKQVAEEIQLESRQYAHIAVDTQLNCVREYFDFYIPGIPISYVQSNRQAVQGSGGTTLYIRPFYQGHTSMTLVKTIKLVNQNKNIFAEFWKL